MIVSAIRGYATRVFLSVVWTVVAVMPWRLARHTFRNRETHRRYARGITLAPR
jgi:hypothetical protein